MAFTQCSSARHWRIDGGNLTELVEQYRRLPWTPPELTNRASSC
jgi:hypothetical protein